MAIPDKVDYLIIGAGIHGLSTAWHLAEKLKAKGKGDGSKILVVEKDSIAAGASGVACGVVRNNYYQPAMRELMAMCVEVWESDATKFHYHDVGYMQISPACMENDVAEIYAQQKNIGYDSVFIQGEKESNNYMKKMFSDWQAKGITSVLHEKRGGYANNTSAIYALADKAEAAGVRILTGTTVKGFQYGSNSTAVTGVETDKGLIKCDQVIVGAGPWIKSFWDMLDLPNTISIKSENGKMHYNYPMWHYWMLTEGVLRVDPNFLKTDDGKMPPVMHVDTDAPLYSDSDKQHLITDKLWGIYYKPDFHFGGIQGGSSPYKVGEPGGEGVNVDPYGNKSKDFVITDEFADMWSSALAFCQKRFEGKSHLFKKDGGGLGCFTPDSFPVFDQFRENVYLVADSNHGYKMLGVGKLVAEEVLGQKSSLLEPFRFSRYEQGNLHPTSNSPFPWS
jgi:glycine/D-amino acid oxidase-like deaminating enzyme|tara:strand:+ start:933 stop:2279 length:1347 start_codon:yes stop_codon:yes gene_type:complete